MKHFILALLSMVMLTAHAADKKITDLSSLGQSSWASGDLFYIMDLSANATKKTSVADFDARYFLGADILGISHGGTGAATKAAGFDALSPMTTSGDVIYGGASGTGTRLAKGSDGQVLTLASGLPSWATPTTYVSSVAMSVPSFLSISGSPITSSGTLAVTLSGTALPIANGGTSATTALGAFDALSGFSLLGDTVYGGTAGTRTVLAGNITTTPKFLKSTGSGSAATAPAWTQAAFTDLSGSVAAAQMPALTGDVTTSAGAVATAIGAGKVTNTMLAGSIASSKLVGSDIATVGTITSGTWTGTTIALANGGTGQTSKAAAFDALSPMTTGGDLIYGGASGTGTRLANGSNGQVLTSAGGTSAPTWTTLTGTGTVTSVAMTVPTGFAISGSPITTNGTLAVTLSNENANAVFVGPTSGSAAAPTFRALDQSDVPATGIRTALVNGAFDFWQATNNANVTVANGVSTYVPDQWYIKNSLGTNGVITGSRVTGVTDGSVNGFNVKITTAPTAAQVNGTEIYQPLDNVASRAFYNKTASFNILVKALGNVNQVGVQFYYATSEVKLTTSIGSEQTCTTNTSTFVSCTINGQALGSSQTAAGIVGVRIRITGVSSGNTYDLNNGFVVEQAQMNLGSAPAPFARLGASSAAELMACQRYYEALVAPGTGAGDDFRIKLAAVSSSTTVAAATVNFVVSKRVVPTMTWGTASNWRVNDPSHGAIAGSSIASGSSVGLTGATVSLTTGGTLTSDVACVISWTDGSNPAWKADARM